MKLGELFEQAVEDLSKAKVETPRLDAEILFMDTLSLAKADFVLQKSRDLSDDEAAKLKELVDLRAKRMPVSRIIGKRGFWKYTFALNENTLDPRADSETLIEAVVKDYDKAAKVRILDLGTGSGCLLLSLLGDLVNAKGVGIDTSVGAVDMAKENAEANGLSDRATFVPVDWRDGEILGNLGKFDVVVANPPYIPLADIEGLKPEVKDYDPMLALAGGDDGLLSYRQIAMVLPLVLDAGGAFYAEIGKDKEERVKEIFTKSGYAFKKEYKDLGGIIRVLKFLSP